MPQLYRLETLALIVTILAGLYTIGKIISWLIKPSIKSDFVVPNEEYISLHGIDQSEIRENVEFTDELEAQTTDTEVILSWRPLIFDHKFRVVEGKIVNEGAEVKNITHPRAKKEITEGHPWREYISSYNVFRLVYKQPRRMVQNMHLSKIIKCPTYSNIKQNLIGNRITLGIEIEFDESGVYEVETAITTLSGTSKDTLTIKYRH